MSEEDTQTEKKKWDVAFTAPLELKVKFKQVVAILSERYLEPPSDAAVLRYLLERGLNAEFADAAAAEGTKAGA